MRVTPRQDIIFVHIPKNAGTSIRKTLSPFMRVSLHNTPFSEIKKKNIKQLIVLRDPVERFYSSVNFTLRTESDAVLLKAEDYDDPNDWVEAIRDPSHSYHEAVMKNLTPRIHPAFDNIDNKHINIRWHFAPQYLWIKNPTYVLMFDKLEEEMRFFFKHILCEPYTKLLNENRSNKKLKELSPKNLRFVQEFYAKDMRMYNYYSSLPIENRILIEDAFSKLFSNEK